MKKMQVYLRKDELRALREVAARADRGVADLMREAIRRTWLWPAHPDGPVAIWDGQPTATSIDHDRTYDER